MNPKALRPGDEKLSPEQRRANWENDMANDLHHDDALWLWAVKAAHVFVEWRGQGMFTQIDDDLNTQKDRTDKHKELLLVYGR